MALPANLLVCGGPPPRPPDEKRGQESSMKSKWIALAAGLAVGLAAGQASAQALGGLWDGVLQFDGASVPFRLTLGETKDGAKASFFDGDRPANPSSRGSFKGGELVLDFDSYGAVLDAHLVNGVLKGSYSSAQWSYPFEARPHRREAPAPGAPNIAGDYVVPVDAANEKAWRLIVKQAGGRASATMLRVDGDSGSLSGMWKGGAFHLSHFAGERPGVLEIRPNKDGSLSLVLTDDDGSTNRSLRAVRTAVAKRQGLPMPADAAHHTSVQDPNAPFRFAARDLSGRLVTNDDPRFKGKVVLVNMMGSWCPNCHDEAPFLGKLYDTYHARGLEIVALDFEYPDQVRNPIRLRAFLKRYGIKYTVLLGGGLEDLRAAAPQAVNLHAWPTTFFVGRDGRVKSVHVGFTSAGSGAYDARLKAGFVREVEQLLGGKG
jgi:thiol-disulfide isomerase/thioredoxin